MKQAALYCCAVAVFAAGAFARDVEVLSDGWTADGEPVEIPHTWYGTGSDPFGGVGSGGVSGIML